VNGRDLLQVSEVESSEAYSIDRDSGEIMLWDGEIGHLVHVNASPRQCGTSVTTFEDATARVLPGRGRGDRRRLRVELDAIDPTALRDETGFWRSLLMDVPVGATSRTMN